VIGPALAAGNTIVVKPSPFTPVATLVAGQVLAEHLPPGVVNVVSGPDPLGEWLTTHPLVRHVHFTGSVATGKKVAAAAAPDLKRVTLELGGNDPAILLDDIDVDAIAERLFWAAFTNTGQVCIAIKRLYVPESRYDDVLEALATRAKDVRVGDGRDPETQLGPINNRPQLDRVSQLVADALDHGAVAAAGGARVDGPGYFFQPTILAEAADGQRIVDEEQFGPALPVLRYRDLDDAVSRANATHYGLGASVWTSDPVRGEQVAARLESGAAWVNTHMGVRPQFPLGGVKWSGLGVAWGRDGFRSFTDPQLVHRARAA
jgi:acyl-CoA reductase-like NAD-dependent aldehyde dehydrogenase